MATRSGDSVLSGEDQLIHLALFLSSCAAAAQLASFARLPPILAYVAVGALLGPPLAGFAPSAGGLTLAGILGVSLSVIEAGLSTDLAHVRKCAFRSLVVAVMGVIFPFAGSCLIIICRDLIYGSFSKDQTFKTAFASGAAVAPTSLGITAALLAKAGEMNTKIGTLIAVAAVLDDVISLLLLSEIKVIAKGNLTPWGAIRPITFAIIFILSAVLVAVLLPMLFDLVLRNVSVSARLRGRLGLWLLATLAPLMVFAALKAETSFLLAAYLAGLTFASVQEDMGREPWRLYIEPYTEWLFMLFFAATIGFHVPLKALFSVNSLGLGALLGFSSTVCKLLCGLGMIPHYLDGFAVAVAMLGRGEFGFLISAEAFKAGLLSERDYAATTWGVAIPTIITTFIFGPTFWFRKRTMQRRHTDSEAHMVDTSVTTDRDTAQARELESN